MRHGLNVDTCPPNYVPEMLVQIDRVDPYGFTGREYHPKKSDEGKLVRVKVVEYGSDFDPEMAGTEDDYVSLTCEVINEHRVLELIDHEVLIVSDPR